MSLGSFGVSIKHQGFVRVAQHLQIIIGFPTVGTHLCEFLGSAVWNEAQSQSAGVNYPLLFLALGGGRSRTQRASGRCGKLLKVMAFGTPPGSIREMPERPLRGNQGV
jgi:hypothetical protein